MAGLGPTYGRGAMTNDWTDIKNSDCILVIGANPAENHPASMAWVNEARDKNKANLIVSTTNNNQAMNESIRQVASNYLDGSRLTEPLLNQIEVAIRAYDPCLSCATHAMGKMPLEITLINENEEVIDRLEKRVSGEIQRTHT